MCFYLKLVAPSSLSLRRSRGYSYSKEEDITVCLSRYELDKFVNNVWKFPLDYKHLFQCLLWGCHRRPAVLGAARWASVCRRSKCATAYRIVATEATKPRDAKRCLCSRPSRLGAPTTSSRAPEVGASQWSSFATVSRTVLEEKTKPTLLKTSCVRPWQLKFSDAYLQGNRCLLHKRESQC